MKKTSFDIGALAVLFLLGISAQHSQADLATYTFTGNSLSSVSNQPNTVVSDFGQSGLNAGPPTATPSFAPTGPAVYYTSDQSGSSQPATTTDYFTFTVTADVGYVLMMNGQTLSFMYGRPAWPPGATVNWSLRSSVDSFASDLGAAAFPAANTWGNASVTLSGVGFDNVTTIEFRLYVWDNQNSSSYSAFFDEFSLKGNVTAVPEPSTTTMLFLGAISLVWVIRRPFKQT